MSRKAQKHLHNAFKNLAKAQEEFEKETRETLRRHENILRSQGQDIANLERQVMNMRNIAIKAQLDAGMSNKDVALNFNLTPSRISQINKRN